ncbi:MAG: HlyD family efflux transporter periplasmic adaptor subunit [Agathobaculum sp.]|jgi:hypothetical protein|uniref:HlyD family efflux transporter periplasmic adaptor subunit n=1 Tax=Agathobaculum sp. TaxID=2048138 RepID=UPI003D94EB79
MDEEKKQNRHRKKQRRNKRLTVLLITVSLVAYFSLQVVFAFSDSIQTVPAMPVTVNDSFTATGWFFRDELPVTGSVGDSVRHTVYSGERVQQSAPLATVYVNEQALALSRELEPLEDKIMLLDTALQSVGSGSDAAKLDQLIALGLQQMAEQAKNGSGAALASSAESLRTLSLRREAGSVDAASISAERNALAAQRDSLQQQLLGKTKEITASASGYFSEIIDGYEQVLSPAELESLSIARFHELIQSGHKSSADGSLGKIIQGFSWYLVAEVPVEQADRVNKVLEAREDNGLDTHLTVSFTQASIETPVSVYKIIQERNADTALLVLEGSDFNSELVSMRDQPIEIILGTYTGLKVPKQAARMVSDGDGGQTLGVYILSGSIQKEKTIQKLYETDSYYVVKQSATDAGALVAQDQIIIRGKDLKNNMVVKK